MLVTETKKPVLLTDCDNVLLNWLAGLPKYFDSIGLDGSHLPDMLKGNPFIKPTTLFGLSYRSFPYDQT